MSLLLDALKRAEEAKRAKLSIDSAPKPDIPEVARVKQSDIAESSGADRSGQAASDLVEQELRIEDYKEVITPKAKVRAVPADIPPAGGMKTELSLEGFSGPALAEIAPAKAPAGESQAPPPVTQSRLDSARADAMQSRDAARSVFVAKQGAAPETGPNKKWIAPVVAVVLVIAGGAGWYVWNEVNRISRPMATNIAARPAATGALAPSLSSTGQPDAKVPVKDNPGVGAEAVEPPLPPLLPPRAAEAPLPAMARRETDTVAALSQHEQLAKSLKDAPVSKEAPVSLQLARSIGTSAVSADLVEGYAALRNADYVKARNLYARLLQADPLNLDAQLGMATIYARRGDSASAVNHYRQALAIDPRNGTALAGLLAVSDARSPALEVELRTLVGRNPGTSSLHFSLGNLYAAERRWVEAQQAYFEAFRLESENADYVYNLAVSLDHLRQPKLALDYYRKALVSSPKAGGQFDTQAVVRRIKELSDQTASK